MSRPLKGCSLLISVLVFILGLQQNGVAQMVNDATQLGLPPQATFGGSDFDLVSFQNGNLHITIPIQSLPERDGKTYKVNYVFDLPRWTLTGDYSQPSGPVWTVDQADSWGQTSHFRLVTPFAWTVGHQYDVVTCSTGQQGVQDQFVLYDPEGAEHPLYLEYTSGSPWCGAANILKGSTLDGTGTLVDISQYPTIKITLKDGTVVGVSANQEDSNGNLMSVSSDMLNRNPLTISNVGSQTYTTPHGTKITGPQYTTWTYTDSNGASQSYTLNYVAIDVNTHFCGFQLPPVLPGDCTEYTGTYLAPSELLLPNSSGTYSFSWVENDAGELAQINLPTGGYIAYTYNTGSMTVQKANTTQCLKSGTQCTTTVLPRDVVANRSVNDGKSTATWKYSINATDANFSGGSVTDPLGNKQMHTYTLLGSNLSLTNRNSVETLVQYYDPSGTLLRTEQKDYAYEMQGGSTFCIPLAPTEAINARQIRLTTTLPNGLVKKKETDYETFSSSAFSSTCPYTTTYLNPTAVREDDWGSGAPGNLLRQTEYTYLHTNNQNYLSRNIADRVLTKATLDGSNNQVALTNNEYDNYSHSGQLMQSSGAIQHDSAYSTSFLYRGNLTAVSRWLKATTYLTTTNQYDDAGNVLSTIDPAGNKTSFNYTDSWANSACNPSGSGKAYPTIVTNALGKMTTYKYYACSGLLGFTTDPNSQNTSFSYDFADRHTQTNFPDGGSTTTSYKDAPPVSYTTTTAISSSMNKVSTVVKDGLGRVDQTQLTSDPSGTDYTDTTYDGLGRVSTVSNPYRTTSDFTYGIATTQYDALSRINTVIQADGSTVSTSYDIALNTTPPANCTLVTDEAGTARKSCMDGLGRMTHVFEDPNGLNYETDYVYDTLDNLTSVTQKGSNSANARTRSFSYDSLSRLTSATNPESGAIQYAYDADSNVLTKTSPSPNQPSAGTKTVTTNYTYDALNRLTGKSYTDAYGNPTTPAVQYGYDGVAPSGCTPPTVQSPTNSGIPTSPTNTIGRRSSMCDGSGATAWVYDAMGRPTIEERTLNGVTKNIGYTYFLDGEVNYLWYPSDNRLVYAVDAAGRPIGVTDQIDNYVADTGYYAPHGGLAFLAQYTRTGSYRAAIGTHFWYNQRLQPTLVYGGYTGTTLYEHCYDYHQAKALTYSSITCSSSATSPSDNGNVYQIVNKFDDTRTQNFTYDSLNRIQSAYPNGSNWGQSFTIDAWGNLTAVSGVAGKVPVGVFTASANTKNQLSCTAGCSTSYDAAGNLLSDGSGAITYDAENRISTAAGVTYTYDGDGKRVMKSNGTLYWTGAGVDALSESDLSGNINEEYVYFNGMLVSRLDRPSDNVHAFVLDHVGSSRMMYGASSSNTALLEQDVDYTPYGIVATGTPNDPHQFSGKERDAESGLDNFMKRYYGSSLGRFQTPDPLVIQRLPASTFLAHLSNPQSWNKYAYVMNNPLSLTDPFGLDFYLTCKQTKDNASTCQGGHVGTTDDKGKFTPTVITSAQLQDPKSGGTGTVTGGGVQITTASGTYGAQFINGTPSATLQGSGALANFTFNITGQNPGNLLRGTWQFNGTPAEAQLWMQSHGAWSYPLDVVNPFHPNTEQFRFSDPNDPSGPSIHISQPFGTGLGIVNGFQIGVVTFPSESQGEFHVDTHGTTWGHIQDVIDVLTR